MQAASSATLFQQESSYLEHTGHLQRALALSQQVAFQKTQAPDPISPRSASQSISLVHARKALPDDLLALGAGTGLDALGRGSVQVVLRDPALVEGA